MMTRLELDVVVSKLFECRGRGTYICGLIAIVRVESVTIGYDDRL
jgi:hypothetical protein